VVARGLRALWPVHDPHGLARGGHLSRHRRPGRRQLGQQRFEPLNSWPTTAIWTRHGACSGPIKQKYGRHISWADLFILAGNVAIESMGGPVFGFAGGRKDVYQSEGDTFWGAEEIWVNEGAQTRISEDLPELEGPLAAIQMGLIYVNPEGPGGNPDPLTSARDMKATFQRMAMNSEETVALTAGGHAFGKAHGAKPAPHFKNPSSEAVHMQGLGWLTDSEEIGLGHITTSGIEGAWSNNPTRWTGDYLRLLFKYDYELTESPAGAKQWTPVNPDPGGHGAGRPRPEQARPDDHDDGRHGLKMDPEFREISLTLQGRPGGARRCLCACVVQAHPSRSRTQDPVSGERRAGRRPDLAGPHSGRHGAHRRRGRVVQGARAGERSQRVPARQDGLGVRFDLPQVGSSRRRQWRPHRARAAAQLGGERARSAGTVLAKLDELRGAMSLADAIVLAGQCGGGEGGARRRLQRRGAVCRRPRRRDAGVDGSRKLQVDGAAGGRVPQLPEDAPAGEDGGAAARPRSCWVCRAGNDSAGGRPACARRNHNDIPEGVLTDRKGQLTNDFFVNLLDNDTFWDLIDTSSDEEFIGYTRAGRTQKWRATRTDLIFDRIRSFAQPRKSMPSAATRRSSCATS
jgi:catalase-peroxidase